MVAVEAEAEAVLVSAIQKLGSWRVEMPLYLNTKVELNTPSVLASLDRLLHPFEYRAIQASRDGGSILTIERRMDEIISEMRMILDFLRGNKVGDGSRKLNYLICDVLHMAQDSLLFFEIEEINIFHVKMDPVLMWLREVKARLLKLGADGAEEVEEEKEEPLKRLLKYISVGEGDKEYVVGLEKHLQLLLRQHIFDDEFNKAFIIKGIVGSGKTTLARHLYNHKDVVDKFEPRAWVCVSTDSTYKQLLMELLQQVVVSSDQLKRGALLEKIKHADNISLQEMLRQHLQGKRFFVVLDDFRDQMPLEPLLKCLLQEEAYGSRLLLTMRIDNGKLIDYMGPIYTMSYLDADDSWKLFLKIISSNNELTSEQTFPKQLHRKGKSMLRKCGGLPLAIKLIGRQSVGRRQSGTEWEEIIESFDLGPILDLLESTYQRLNLTMKTCFLHFSFFKENASIKAYKLIEILYAGSEVLYKKGVEECLFKLDDRESIIEMNYSEVWLKYKSCRINSLFHALSIKKAEAEIGLEILRNNGNYQPTKSPRHRVISSYSRDEFKYSTNQGHRHIVSLFFHGGGYFDDSSSYWETLEQLRILDLDGYGIKVLPEVIGALVELRYLGLRNNYLRELPYSLGCLINLEVVDIAQNYMMEVPDIIWKMCSLRHIYMSDIICQRPLKIGALKNLSSLTYISVDNWTYDLSGLTVMKRLKKLGIEELDVNSDVSKLFASLSMLSGLKTLILRGFRFKSMPCLDKLHVLRRLSTLKLGGLLQRLPSVDNFPPYIEYLKLYDSCLNEDPMPILERLSSLRSLKLRNAYTGKQMVISCNGFLWLKYMRIKELWNLKNVQVGEGGVPELSQFNIKNCPYLKTLPKNISSSVKIKIDVKM